MKKGIEREVYSTRRKGALKKGSDRFGGRGGRGSQQRRLEEILARTVGSEPCAVGGCCKVEEAYKIWRELSGCCGKVLERERRGIPI